MDTQTSAGTGPKTASCSQGSKDMVGWKWEVSACATNRNAQYFLRLCLFRWGWAGIGSSQPTWRQPLWFVSFPGSTYCSEMPLHEAPTLPRDHPPPTERCLPQRNTEKVAGERTYTTQHSTEARNKQNLAHRNNKQWREGPKSSPAGAD